MRMIIKNARIINTDNADNKLQDIFIENGMIKAISDTIHLEAEHIIDASGYIVMPGFIDMSCHICDPGFEGKENIETALLSAAKGGFTSITAEPDTYPAADNRTVIEYIISKSKTYNSVNVYPYGSMTKGCLGEEIAEIGDMISAGAVAISDGGHGVDNSRLLKNIFKYSKMFDIPVITHCQDRNLAAGGVINEGIMSTILGVKPNPREAEDVAVARNIILAENIGCKLHLSDISTKGSVQLIREAKNRGVNIIAQTSPHYFILTEQETDGYNVFAKVKPPLRTFEDVTVIKEAIKDGTIDIIASGHMPTTLEAKLKEFDEADFGISSFETAFSTSYTQLVEKNIITANQLVQKMSYNPSNALKLKRKGQIKEGFDADIIIADVNNDYEIDAKLFMSKAKFTPFQQQTVKGKIVHTIIGGKLKF